MRLGMACALGSTMACGGGGGGGGGRGPIVLPTTRAELVEPESFAVGPPGVGASPAPEMRASLFMSDEERDALSAKIMAGDEPFATQFAIARSRARTQVPPDPDVPSDVYDGTDIDPFRETFEPDADAMLDAAVAARFPEFLALGEREALVADVRDYLLSWARNSLTGVSSINDLCQPGECQRLNAGLFLAVPIIPYVYAYDLVLEDPALSDADHAEIRAYLEKVHALIRAATEIWGGGPAAGGPPVCHRFSNHASHHIAAMVAIGYILEDPARVDEAIEGTGLRYGWSTLLRDSIYMQGDPVLGCESGRGNPTFTGEMYDRYRHYDVPGVVNDPDGDPASWSDVNRGYGYSMLAARNLAVVAEMALHRGRDLYRAEAASGESLELPGRYYAYYKFLIGPGRHIIEPSGFQGEVSYIGEVQRDDYNYFFEFLSARYHQNAEIIRALEPYDQLALPRPFFTRLFFGRVFDPRALEWEFHLDGVSEGWALVQRGQVAAASVSDGALHLESAGSDPALQIEGLLLDALRYRELVIRMRVSGTPMGMPNPRSEFSWTNESGGGGSVSFVHEADGTVREYRVSLDTVPSWSFTDNRVLALRFDPVANPGLDVDIEAIRLVAEGP